jgi:membrane protease subunit HflK
MFDRLWDLLAQVWLHLVPIYVIQPYQNGGLTRLGIYKRTLPPGWHWKVPFADEVNTQNVSDTTMRLPQQTIPTADGVDVVVAVEVNYFVNDVKEYICRSTDQADVLIDSGMGAVFDEVSKVTLEHLLANRTAVMDSIVENMRKVINKYGFRINRAKFTDLGRIRTIRLMTPHAANLAN